jgi:hypothetical protein
VGALTLIAIKIIQLIMNKIYHSKITIKIIKIREVQDSIHVTVDNFQLVRQKLKYTDDRKYWRLHQIGIDSGLKPRGQW